MRLAAAVVSTCVMVAGLTTPTAAQVAVARYTPPPIQWGTCADPNLRKAGATCGDLVVPLDYAHPDGREDHPRCVARPAHVTGRGVPGRDAHQPGGPGGSGLNLAALGRFVPNHAGDAYDWIGFDPRGVGASRAVAVVRGTLLPPRPADYVPRTRHLMRVWLAVRGTTRTRARKAAATGCSPTRAPATPSATWRACARRWAQATINFYGFSYGTYLGQVYATLHPDPGPPLRPGQQRRPPHRLVPRQPQPGRRLRPEHQDLLPLAGALRPGLPPRRQRACRRASLLPAAQPARPSPRRRGARTRRAHRRVHDRGVLRLRLGGHRQGVRRPAAPRTFRRPGQALPEYQPGRPGRGQPVRDVPRHRVHRRPVAAQLGAGSDATTGGSTAGTRS